MENNYNKVRVYILDISNKPYDPDKLSLLEPARRKNIEESKNYLYKLRAMYAGLLLRHALRCEGAELPAVLDVKYTEYGKPYVEGGKHFSITHSGNLVMVAVADFEIGLDAEIKQNKVYTHIADRILSEREYSEYSAVVGAAKSEYFLSKWVVKESYLKCLGTGIRKYPADVEVYEDNVNGYPYVSDFLNYRNYSYYVALTAKQAVSVEPVYVATLKAL